MPGAGTPHVRPGGLITIADTLVPVAATEDGKAYLAPKAICDDLGIAWPAQRIKIMADPVLSSGVSMIDMPSSGGVQSTLMLPKEMVPVAATEDGKAYLSPKAICDSLGISWQGQHEKIKNDPVLSSCVKMILMRDPIGRMQEMAMLPKEMVPGWLFTIKKVAPEVQAKLNRFRLECFVALDTWFNKGLRRNEAVMQQYGVPTRTRLDLAPFAREG